jgi:hypothetical protein
LYGGSKLKSSLKMIVVGGTVVTRLGGGTADATIETSLMEVRGGDIRIGDDATHTFGTLTNQGEVLWISGTYHPVVQQVPVIGQLSVAGAADLWKVTNTLTVRRTAVGVLPLPDVAPKVIDPSGAVVTPASGLQWKIVESLDAIQAVDMATYNQAVWEVIPDGNPVIQRWFLKAK